MSCVHYKFFSKLKYDTVTFDGLHISLCDLKKQIMRREKLKAASCDLQISNAETEEEYTGEDALIRKNSSVIVRRVPVGGVPSTSKTYVLGLSRAVSGTSEADLEDPCASISVAQLIKTANLAEADAPEEDKIKAMMVQSAHQYDPINYMKKPLGPPPPSYTCFRCGKPGHYIKNCPTNGDKNFEPLPRIRKSTGIPRSFMMEVKDPNTKGAMLSNTGKYVIPIIHAEAYAIGKKEKPLFLAEEPSSPSQEEDPIPDELLCLLCKDIVTDAVVIPCCGNSYCDECIRTALLESDEHRCPTCHQNDVSPDALIANKFLRQAIDRFKKESGCTKRLEKQICPPAPPPPPPRPPVQRDLQPVRRLLISRQQDPLIIPGTPSASASASASAPAATPRASSTTPNQPSLSSAGPRNQPSTPAPDPDRTATEKPDGPLRDPEDKSTPAAALLSDHPDTSSSLATSALTEEKGGQIRVPGAPSLLGQSLWHGQPIPTIHPLRTNAAQSAAGGRRGWKASTNRRRSLGERSHRTQGPSLPATPVPPPRFPPHFPPGQPPPPAYSVPPPAFPPAPTALSTAGQTAHSKTIPATGALPLSREDFYREQRRLREEERKKSRPDDFTKGSAKELMECRKIPKKHRRSFSRSKSPSRGSCSSRSSHIYAKWSCGSSRSPAYSPPFRPSRSPSYSPFPPCSRRGRGKSRNYPARSRSRGYHCSRSRSPPYRGWRSRSRSPAVFRGRSPHRRNTPQGETAHRTRNKGASYPEKSSARRGRTTKDRVPSKEKENENPPADGKANRQEKRRKRRKEEDHEASPNTELLESPRKKRKC
ncbi:E3 ubiquitin-protein ligase RBBP6-like [Gracilinanus agilis]|uniref:E3 ubiquitin-protein ligase RBBP6-like n=1 Tax=Gracilinanus agilis TaxID=191870 RepID=UPI001CFEE43E|nr:E3 ubiquitin-protein ligase RBBP6-like [Gracilinanus agilis]